MIAADTNAVIDYLMNRPTRESQLVTDAISHQSLCLPPIVVTELLSDRNTSPETEAIIGSFRMLAIADGYWVRAAASRRATLKQGHKTRTADALIAQACIDADVALITRDADFRTYAQYCGLKLA